MAPSKILLAAAAAAAAVASGFSIIDESAKNVLSDDILRTVNTNPAATWKAGHNSRFEGMTVGQARSMMGVTGRDADSKNMPVIQHDEATIRDTPSSYDPRVSRKSCTGPVLDQGTSSSFLLFLSVCPVLTVGSGSSLLWKLLGVWRH